jgi:hypothetical protein
MLTGEHERAEGLVRTITAPDLQAKALVKLAGKAEPAHARQLISRALSKGTWTLPLAIIAEVEPRALTTIADEFLQNL